MSAGGSKPRLGLSGRYGIVGHRGGAAAPLGQVKELEDGSRRRELVDEETLDEDSRKALEADDFIIFGRASVEQFDDDEPSQMLTMEALAKALPQLFEDGIISRRHKDIPVGEVLSEHTLEEAAEFQIGEDGVAFDSGETLETQVVEEGESRPGSEGAAQDDEFWIVANLKNNSEIAKETRLRALAGDLNGFSVTIYAKEWRDTAEGQVVTDLDWHAVTIGEEHKIKNKDSRFGVAEFKAFFEDRFSGVLGGASDDVGSASDLAEGLHHKANTTMSHEFNGQLFTKAGSDLGFDESRLQAAATLAQKADDTDEESLREKADEIAEQHDLDADALVTTAKALSGTEDEKADIGEDLQAILDQVEEQIGEEAASAIRIAMDGPDAGNADDGSGAGEDAAEAADGEMKEDVPGEDGEEEEEDEDEKSAGGDDPADLPDGVVTEEKLEERLEELKGDMVSSEDIESMKSDLEGTMQKAMEDALPSIVEDTAEKMSTGGTPSPAGGSTHDSVDYTEEIQGAFSAQGGD